MRLALLVVLSFALAGLARAGNSPIPYSGSRARAKADCQGDALAVTATPDAARLRCGFQKLQGRATSQGLWLDSTVPAGGGLRLVATSVHREVLDCGSPLPLWHEPGRSDSNRGLPQSKKLSPWSRDPAVLIEKVLPTTGTVAIEDKLARFARPGLTEEYSVSMDGVRQDFIITERPAGAGDLWVELALTGARAEAAAYGAKLILDGSGRALAYSRLRATDATGQELRARLEVLSAKRLAARVWAANATYPVRIDPTFSAADWVSLNPTLPGANGVVRAVAVDGSGNVYVGGDFTVIGTVVVNHTAVWDGNAWSALGAGVGSGRSSNSPAVFALAVSGTNLYAGGSFTTAGKVRAANIAKWDGSAWSALGSGLAGEDADAGVGALAVSGTNLYAGGWFTTAGGVAATNIAKWDGDAWSALGSGLAGAYAGVGALAATGSRLYAGGTFTTAGGVAATNIAVWDGSAWSALGSGMNDTVSALAVGGTNLYAGGWFDKAGGVTANYIAAWDGSAWSALGSGLGGVAFPFVYGLAVSGTDLYAGGTFTTAGGVAVNRIAKWDGSAWSALGSGLDGDVGSGLDYETGASVAALAVSGTNLYVGGNFTTAGGEVAYHIAKWDSSAWLALGPAGVNSNVYVLAVSGTNLYAGGAFTHAGGVTANCIAAWDGNIWSALGSGVNGPVWALAVSGTNLYAGGSFTTAGGVSANYIAAWNGSRWSALGSGTDASVSALAVSGTTLYAGGNFTNAGGVSANGIAAWNGGSWSALGLGMDSSVSALAVSGTTLYAGGDFFTAGGVPAKFIAKWDGSAWSALGPGMDGTVLALAASGTTLYAGGDFAKAGGMTVNYIARWNGSAWSPLGSGVGWIVEALALNGTDLYAGGKFTTASGVWANYIAKWNGGSWSPLFPGTDDHVDALAVDGAGHMFVGGGFSLAGSNVSPFIAQANIGLGAVGGRFDNPGYSPATGFSCAFSDATTGQVYRIQTSASLASGIWTDFTNLTYTGPFIISDPSPSSGPKKFYRAISP